MAYITFFTLVILLAIQSIYFFGEPYLITYLTIRFERMYPRLIICYYIHKYFLVISWKPLKQFARCPNMRRFCSSLSKCGVHQVLSSKYFTKNAMQKLLKFQTWPQSAEKYILCLILLKKIFFNNIWTTCRFRSTRFMSICNRPYACTEFPNLSANCGK